MAIKKGYKVLILSGKDKKKEGEVIELDRSSNRAKVKDINMIKKHICLKQICFFFPKKNQGKRGERETLDML